MRHGEARTGFLPSKKRTLRTAGAHAARERHTAESTRRLSGVDSSKQSERASLQLLRQQQPARCVKRRGVRVSSTGSLNAARSLRRAAVAPPLRSTGRAPHFGGGGARRIARRSHEAPPREAGGPMAQPSSRETPRRARARTAARTRERASASGASLRHAALFEGGGGLVFLVFARSERLYFLEERARSPQAARLVRAFCRAVSSSLALRCREVCARVAPGVLFFAGRAVARCLLAAGFLTCPAPGGRRERRNKDEERKR